MAGRSILAAGLALAALLPVVAGPPGAGAQGPLTLTLTPDSGRPGRTIAIAGSGFNANGVVRLTWDAGGRTEETIDVVIRDGVTWQRTWTIPSVTPGGYVIRACELRFLGDAVACDPDRIVDAVFRVVRPDLTLSRNRARVGLPFTVVGRDFIAGSAFVVAWDPGGRTEQILLTGRTDGSGGFSGRARVPTVLPGRYRIVACTARGCDGLDRAITSFTVIVPPTPDPSATPRPTIRRTFVPDTKTAPDEVSPAPLPTPAPTPVPTATATPTASPSPAAPAGSPAASGDPGPVVAGVAASPSPPGAAVLPLPSPSPSPSVPPAPVTPVPSPSPSPSPSVAPSLVPGATPTPPQAPPPPGWAASVTGPSGSILADPGALLGALLLGTLVAFILPFPGTIFGKTAEANHDAIADFIRRRRSALASLPGAHVAGRLLGRAASGRAGLWIFVLLSALVYGFLDPAFGPTAAALPVFFGILAGLGIVTVSFDLPLRIVHRRIDGDGGFLKPLWWTLPVGIGCVLLSRAAGMQPGYLYGLIASATFLAAIPPRVEGRALWIGAAWLLVVGLAAWVGLDLVRATELAGAPRTVLETALAAIVVGAVESLAIGLLPLRFLPGGLVFAWSRPAWIAAFAVGATAYLVILVNPASGYLADTSRTPLLIAVAFLGGFAILSLAFWAWFRFRPAAGDAAVREG